MVKEATFNQSNIKYIVYLTIQATATRINLIMLLALARVVYQQTVIQPQILTTVSPDSATKPINETGFRRYEMCIKEIMICFMLQDGAIDYDDVDYLSSEDIGDVHVRDKENIVHWQFRKANCVPLNVSSATRKKFWKTVQLWQEEVEKFFLAENMFIHSQEDNGKIKIKLWDVHKMPQNVTCNKTLTDPIVPPIVPPKEKVCDEGQAIALWIRDQIAAGKRIDTLTSKGSHMLDQMSERFHNEGCHSYADIRNKINMINDNIDFILRLRGGNPPRRLAASGNTRLDLQNLTVRLQYLKQHPMGSYQCCMNWELEVEGVKERIMAALLEIDRPKIDSEYEELQRSYSRLQEQYAVQLNRLIQAEEAYRAQVNAVPPPCDRCTVLETKVKVLGRRMQYRGRVIKSSMRRKFGVRAKPNLELIDTDSDSMNDRNDREQDNWDIIHSDESLENIEKKIKKINQDANGIMEVYGKLSRFVTRDEKTRIRDLKKKLTDLLEQHKKLSNPMLRRTLNSFDSYDNNIELSTCFRKLNSDCPKQTDGSMDLSKQETEITNIDTRISENIILLKKLRRESRDQATQIEDFKEQLNNRIEERQKLIELSDAKESNRLKLFRERIDRLEKSIIAANDNSEGFSKINEKLRALEKGLDKIGTTSDIDSSLLLTIEKLKMDLADLNERIDNIDVSAHKCSNKCDWGDLPTYEELLDRLNALKRKI